jgi:hypothetical protein
MKGGSWRLTHQGIAFNCDGTLLDGQHRLAAIIESGIAVQMLVARGVETANQMVMDDHAKRNASDALTLVRGERVSTMDVAIIRAAVELQASSHTAHKSKTELNDLVEQFMSALKFTKPFLTTKQRGVTGAAAWGAIALAWFYVPDLVRLNTFCSMLTGAEMVQDESDRAAITLREWLLRTGTKNQLIRREAFMKTQRAIVAFMRHEGIARLHGTSVHYPWPLIDPVRTR